MPDFSLIARSKVKLSTLTFCAGLLLLSDAPLRRESESPTNLNSSMLMASSFSLTGLDFGFVGVWGMAECLLLINFVESPQAMS